MTTLGNRTPGGRTHFAELLAKRFKGGQEIGRLLDDALARIAQVTVGLPVPHAYTHNPGGVDALDYSGVPGNITGGASAQGDGGISRSGHTHGIDDGAIAIAKLADIAANSILGNNTGGAGPVLELTATQVTAMLNVFTNLLKGLVPASGGGTANFLRADGAWAVPPGSGGGGGSSDDGGVLWAWYFSGVGA